MVRNVKYFQQVVQERC